MAAESSTGTWTTVWTDLLTDLDYYKGRAYRIEDVPGDDDLLLRLHRLPDRPVRGRLGGQRVHLAGGQRVRLQGRARACVWRTCASRSPTSRPAAARPTASRSSAT
ncbi:MAG: hypothetical protein MZV65_30780 [Chromatiales bacterium]|nr:hypothetical protein [Chromatiales bacterium]